MAKHDGKDAFGEFLQSGNATCSICNQRSMSTIMYLTLKLPEGIQVEATVLGRAIPSTPLARRLTWFLKQPIGINCGCYAKFHRQVAHIEDRMKARKAGVHPDVHDS